MSKKLNFDNEDILEDITIPCIKEYVRFATNSMSVRSAQLISGGLILDEVSLPEGKGIRPITFLSDSPIDGTLADITVRLQYVGTVYPTLMFEVVDRSIKPSDKIRLNYNDNALTVTWL